MNALYIIIGIIIALVLMEIVKHMFFKRTAKLIMVFFIVLILFLLFSFSFKNIESFQDNKFIQTGAVVAGKFVDLFKEKVDTEAFVNSTLKSSKLFKS